MAKGERARVGRAAGDKLSQEKNFDLEPNINGKPLKDFKQEGIP